MLTLQMFLEELQRPPPGILRGFWTVTVRSHIAIERVWRVGINLIVVRLAVFLHLLRESWHLRGNRLIQLSVITQNRCINVFDSIEILWNRPVVYYCGCQVLALGREKKSFTAAPTKSDNSNFIGLDETLTLDVVLRPHQVFHQVVVIQFRNRLHYRFSIRKRASAALTRNDVRHNRNVTSFS